MQTVNLDLRVGKEGGKEARLLLGQLNWQIEAGQCWAVIGRNGAGKSTLLRSIAGMRPIESGQVLLDGRSLADWDVEALARRRAYLPQARADAFGYRVIEAVLAARHPFRHGAYWESAQDYAAAENALVALDVAGLAERDLRSLSGGERQRVAIAAVLAQETPLLLLDEPVNTLDLPHQVSVMELFGGLCRSAGRSVVMVSHDLNMAHIAATHALLMMPDGGWHAGPLAEVFQVAPLSACLGYPIEVVEHAGRPLFVPGRANVSGAAGADQ